VAPVSSRKNLEIICIAYQPFIFTKSPSGWKRGILSRQTAM